MTFGWQGFELEHPEDWAPASVAGTFREGYARLTSSNRIALQIRWRHNKSAPAMTRMLSAYEEKLRGDAKRAGEPFQIKAEAEEAGTFRYHWTGQGQGRGCLFFSEACRRVFFLEVLGARKDAILPIFRQIRESFASQAADLQKWGLLGLEVKLPKTLMLQRHTFQAGKTALTFSGPKWEVECMRWGFAEQLLERYSLADWAKSATSMRKSIASEEAGGIRLTEGGLLKKKEALICHQTAHNQIVTVKTIYRSEAGRPTWDWLI